MAAQATEPRHSTEPARSSEPTATPYDWEQRKGHSPQQAPPDNHVTSEMQAQEQAWALAAQQGDSAAFMHIVDAFQRPVYNLCYRMLNDAGEAEDAAQETFMRAYTKLGSYNPSHKFSSWILSIASHYCIDRLRKRRHQTVSWDDLPPWRGLPTTEPQPEDATLTQESHESVHTLLNTLPADYKAAVVLRYWQEMSYDEIAATLNTSVSAIKSRLFRARQMLADAAQLAEAQNAALRLAEVN